MANDQIGGFVEDSASQELNQILQQLKDIAEQIKTINASGIKLSAQTTGSGSIPELIKNTDDLKKNTDELAISMREYGKLSSQAATLTAKLSVAESDQAKSTSGLRQQVNDLNAQMREEAKAAQAAEGSLNKLRAQLNLMVKQYDAMGKAEREAADGGKALLKNIQDQTKEISALEEETGRHQRNVGNYMGALSNVYSSLAKIANIIPGLGISGIFMLGFEALQTFTKIDIVGFFTKGAEAAKKAAEENQRYKDSLAEIDKNARKASEEELTRINVLTKIAADTTTAYQTRINAVDELQKKYPDYFGNLSKEEILNNNVAAAIDGVTQALMARSFATAAEQKATEAAERSFEFTDKWRQTTKELNKEQDKLNRLNQEFSNISATNERRADFLSQRIIQQQITVNGLTKAQAEYRGEAHKAYEDAKSFTQQAAEWGKKAGALFVQPTAEKKGKKEKKERQKELLQSMGLGPSIEMPVIITPPDPKDMEAQWKRIFDQIDKQIEENEKKNRKKRNQEIFQGIQDVAHATAQAIGETMDLFNSQLDTQAQRLEDQKTLVDELTEKQLEAVDKLAISDEEKAKRRADLEAAALAQKKSIDRQESAIKRKQAQNDRVASVANIIEATGVAIMNAVEIAPPFGAILAALYAGMGAVQLAKVLTTPLPSYWTGTKNSKEGLAWVGERGTEMSIGPDGRIGFTPDKATMTYLKAGTQIIDAEKTKAILKNIETGKLSAAGSDSFNDEGMIAAINKNTTEIVKAVRANKQTNSRIEFELYAKYKTRKM